MAKSSLLDSILSEAANEAIGAGYPQITPGHVLIALARASEMGASDSDPALGPSVRREFEELGIEPRRFRRRLRGLFGNGGTQYQGGAIHRSLACKAILARSERMASDQGAWDASCLVRAVFAGLAGDAVSSESPANTPHDLLDIPTEL